MTNPLSLILYTLNESYSPWRTCISHLTETRLKHSSFMALLFPMERQTTLVMIGPLTIHVIHPAGHIIPSPSLKTMRIIPLHQLCLKFISIIATGSMHLTLSRSVTIRPVYISSASKPKEASNTAKDSAISKAARDANKPIKKGVPDEQKANLPAADIVYGSKANRYQPDGFDDDLNR